MTTEELAAVKEYLLENLHKGFIVPSSALSDVPYFTFTFEGDGVP